jgi:hypothetical protein
VVAVRDEPVVSEGVITRLLSLARRLPDSAWSIFEPILPPVSIAVDCGTSTTCASANALTAQHRR